MRLIPRTGRAGGEVEQRKSGSRADPFLLLPDTPFRFGLLVVAIFSTSLFAYQMLYLTTHDAEFARTTLACDSGPAASSWDAAAKALEASAECRQDFERTQALWMIAGIVLVAVVATLLLVVVPRLLTRRHVYVPVEQSQAPELAAELQALAERAGTAHVRFLLDPFDARTSAFAFGRPGHRGIVLRGGLVTLTVTDRLAFRAIVLHELAHVRNRDIDQAYFAITTFIAFLLVAVLPFALVLQGGLPVLAMAWRLGALVLLVYLLFLALLRSRERYADARALAWGSGEALSAVLMRARHDRRLLGRALALHPAPGSRARSLHDPAPLFRLTFLDALAVGLVAAIALPQLVFLVGLLTAASLSSAAWASVPVAPLVAGFLTVGIWRQRYLDSTTGARRRVWPLGCGLALGLALGPTISINATGNAPTSSAAQALVWHAAWSLLVVGLVAPLASWMAEGAAANYDHDTGAVRLPRPRSARLSCLVAVAVSSWIIGYLLYRLELLRLLSSFSLTPDLGLDDVFRQTFVSARGLLGPNVLWSWPHVVALVAVLALPWITALVPRRTLIKSLAMGGVVAVVLPVLLSLSIARARDYPLRVRWPVAFSLELHTFWLFTAAPVVCALAAGTAALVARRRPLAAAGVAVAAAAVATFAVFAFLRPAQSCIPGLTATPFSNSGSPGAECPAFSSIDYLEQLLPQVLAGALGATVIAVPVIAAIGQGLRGLRARYVLSPRAGLVSATGGALVAIAAAVVAVSLTATYAAHRAADAAAKVQPVDIGDDGTMTGTGYRLQLVTGWIDVTEVARRQDRSVDLLLTDTNPVETTQGAIVVYHGESSAGLRDQVRADASLRPRDFTTIDGEKAVEMTGPNRSPGLYVEVITEHAGHAYKIELWGSPDSIEINREHFGDMLRSWHWTG